MLGAMTATSSALPRVRPRTAREVDLFERHCFFTDDTVLTIATADALLTDGDYTRAYREWGRRYPNCSWGSRFHDWLFGDDPRPYNSFGNGSPCASAPSVGPSTPSRRPSPRPRVRRRQPQPPRGHQGRPGHRRRHLPRPHRIHERRHPPRDHRPLRLRPRPHRSPRFVPDYTFDDTCQGSVPEALIAFLDADDFEHTLRLAISLGGDADTQAAIAGAVAEAFWGGLPPDLEAEVERLLPADMAEVVRRFQTEHQARVVSSERGKPPERTATRRTPHATRASKSSSSAWARPTRKAPGPCGERRRMTSGSG